MAKTCPTCGQVIPPKIELPPVKQRIYDALCKRPRTAEELRQIAGIFDFRRDEPLNEGTIHSHVWFLRRLLKPHGLTIAKSTSKFEPYRLVVLAAQQRSEV